MPRPALIEISQGVMTLTYTSLAADLTAYQHTRPVDARHILFGFRLVRE